MKSQPLLGHPACLLTQLDVHVQEQVTALLTPLGISPRQYGVLSLLSEQDGLSQHELCRALNIHRNVMVDLVDELEARGLAQRRRHPADRRAHALHLLPAGRQLHAEAEALLDRFEAKLLGGLDVDEATAFVALLQRVSVDAGLITLTRPGITGP
ncbi:MarR family winged helix-turn-helix transcriptional regulator [Streptomyces sp. NBC_01198]|uniref:MarR family winged helix-turn-helix transcriptional regulator n=1 Tax=Streptomyces sp. NBC_01198 TaxID=2903769 RepID=UPI002E14EFD3|nr:MarR family transcriptional regulator [Streptomyces sp. NBC_01198]